MYELMNGSARLVYALERCSGDPARMKRLANILYYCENQLGQDIQALADLFEQRKTVVSDDRSK